jgi:hypothetical protein
MRLSRIISFGWPDYYVKRRKTLPVLLITFLITSTYFQLKHPYRPAIVSLVSSADELPPAVRALLKVDNKKASEEISKAIPSVFTETSLLVLLVCLNNDHHDISSPGLNTTVNVPDKPYLRLLSPPPEF